jgi:hypothetical protein
MSNRKLQFSAEMLSGKASKKDKVPQQKLEDVAAFGGFLAPSLDIFSCQCPQILYHRAQKILSLELISFGKTSCQVSNNYRKNYSNLRVCDRFNGRIWLRMSRE